MVHNPFPKQGNNIQGQFCKQRSIEPINWKGSKKAQLDFNNDLQLSGPEFVSGDKISGIDEEMMRVSHIPYKSMVDSHLGIEQQGDLVKMLEML